MSYYFREVAPGMFRVQKDKQDRVHRGIIERHEYTEVKPTGKRVQRVFWIARGIAHGWKDATKKRFETREAAANHLMEQSNTPYQDRKMEWDPGNVRARKEARKRHDAEELAKAAR